MAILRRLARQAGLRRTPRLRVTDAVAGPMLVGLLRPTILLPKMPDETGERAGLSSILAHELAHVRTHDLWWNVALEALCYVLWFHPAAWRVARIHETACEEACDADAVRLDGNADGYRRTLARLALDMAGVRPGLAIPMARPAHIARRVRALANPVGCFRAQWRRAVTPGLVVLALLTAFAGLSCYRRGPAGLYETAPGTTGRSFTLEPTTFTLDAVARWHRDGSVRVEDGKGAPAEWGDPLPDHSGLTPYMDVAEFRIGPDADVFDVTDVRVFDHATQVMLGFNDGRRVTFVIDGHVLRVRALNAPLPDELDVWFRVRHRPKGDPAWILQPQAGSQATVDGFTVRLRELAGGGQGYTMRSSPGKPSIVVWNGFGDGPVTQAVIDLIDPRNVARGERFQLCVVDESGRRLYSDFFLSTRNGITHVPRFSLERTQIQQFEVRPLYEACRFYFEKVRLPQADPTPIEVLPALEFAIDGKEGAWTSDLLGPEAIRVTVSRGRIAGGVSCPVNGAPYFTPPAKPNPTGTTVMIAVDEFDFTDATMTPLSAAGDPLKSGSRSMSSACGHWGSIRSWHFSTELEDIARVRIAFDEE
ncbi:MAG: M56 family metallopeptidase [bacterium]|nr:M56 family metallopeptidase [bacterium]